MDGDASLPRPKQRFGRRATFLVGLLAGPILLIITVLMFSNGFASQLSNSVAANMVPPETSEMAVTAFSPPASTDEIAAISGRGEGLDCSIEPIIERRAFPSGPGEASVNLQYRQACVAHDYCYRHGAATYGYTQADCDAMLARSALRICHFSHARGDEACLRRVRKVYAGLVFGGAGAFRSVRPDRGGATGFGEGFRKALKRRFGVGRWGGPSNGRVASDWRHFLGPPKELWRMSNDGLSRLLDAWLDVASTTGEYDPYPLGSARYALPRLIRVGGRGRALVFYKRRPGGSELAFYRWSGTTGHQTASACAEGGCAAPALSLGAGDRYAAMPGPPQVAAVGNGAERLVWWRRLDTGAESTGGNLVTAEWAPSVLSEGGRRVPSAWRFRSSNPVEMAAPAAYLVPRAQDDYLLASITDQFARAQSKDPDVAIRLWRGHPTTSKAWSAFEGGSRVALKSEGGATLVASQAFRGTLASPLRVRASADGGVDVTILTRAERSSTFRGSLTAWIVRVAQPDVPVAPDGKPRPLPPAHLAPVGAAFDIPETAEPAVPLGATARDLRFVTVQCVGGTPEGPFASIGVKLGWFERPRCSGEDSRTVVTLHRRSGEAPIRVWLPGRYVSRAVIVRNPSSDPGAPHDLLVLVRFLLVHDRGRPALKVLVRVVGLGPDYIWTGHEVGFGIVSPERERSLAQALTRASRLYPLVGDVDGNGSEDLILADPVSGPDSLALLNVVHRQGVPREVVERGLPASRRRAPSASRRAFL